MGRFSGFFITLLVVLIPSSLLAATPKSLWLQTEDHSLVVIRGRAVCLDSAGREADSLFGCNDTGKAFGFASKDGKLYKFLPTDSMTPVFSDVRVRQRELQLSARMRSGDKLEIIKVQSVKEGKLYDIFYYCDICSITSYTPGPCPCCGKDLEFREKLQ